jgi:hypothetical protein
MGSLAIALAAIAVASQAQDFRVDTEVFVGAEKKPAIETLTIFADGSVYDFVLTEPRETTIFDPVRGKITLLNESERVRAAVTTQELMTFSQELEAQASQRKDPLLVFAARPKFESKFENVQQNGQALEKIELRGKPLEYIALGQPAQRPEAALAYRQFADWYARLNATRPLNLPAGARLELNKALAEHYLLPLEITRTITSANPVAKKHELKTRHLVNWKLSAKDQKEIERANDSVATFRAISFDEYRRLAR